MAMLINVPLGYEQNDDLDTVQTLTVPEGAKFALIQVEAQTVRWRDDGEDPTTAAGMQLKVGETLTYTGDLSALKFIEETAGAVLNVSYYI